MDEESRGNIAVIIHVNCFDDTFQFTAYPFSFLVLVLVLVSVFLLDRVLGYLESINFPYLKFRI